MSPRASAVWRLCAMACSLVLAQAGAGCSHYRLGSGAAPAFQTLFVEPVKNPASLPQAEALVSTVLREQFIRDGRVRLVSSPEGADATLSVSLIRYGREEATSRPGDTGLARKFALTLTATVTLHDRRAGTDLLAARPIDANRDAFTDGGQLQSEYEALPLLADVLAKKIVKAALDVW